MLASVIIIAPASFALIGQLAPDIFRAAQVVIERHGEAAVWLSKWGAIEELRGERGPDRAVN